jgi:hypothetical protein
MKTPSPPSLMDQIQRQLERVESPGAERQRLIDELFSLVSKEGVQGWAYVANCLFFAIARHHGPEVAQSIFKQSGPIPKRLRNALANATVLDRLMKPKLNKKALARELAKEAGRADDPDEVQRFYEHIRDLQKALKSWRAKHPLPGGI